MKILALIIGLALVANLDVAIADPSAIDQQRDDYRRPLQVPFPASNPYSFEKAALGKALFFDPRLSGNQDMNCASCHNPSFGWKVPLRKPTGAKKTELARSAPTLLNLAWGDKFFWDGRAPSLEAQARGPIEDEAEMNLKLVDATKRLNAIDNYRGWFSKIFPDRGISPDTIVMAIATYERTIVSGYAPFDAWVDGDDGAISNSAKRGFAVFTGKGGCAMCHSGWNFTDDMFHDTGIATDDIGRSRSEPDNAMAVHAFKTPGLRDVAIRAPYLHDGSRPTLESVVALYTTGGVTRPSVNIRPVDLSAEEVASLIDFLRSLTCDKQVVSLPILPH